VIGFSFGNETASIYPLIANPAVAEAKKKGYQLIQGDANGSCTKQVQNLQDFIARPVNAIVVLPLCGPSEVQASLKQAEAHHIVVVGYSQPVYGSSAAIEYNNVAGSTAVGNNAANWYRAHFKKGQPFSWVLFTYDQCGTPCTQRTNPIRRIVEKATGVAPIEEVGADNKTGYTEMQSVLVAHPKVNMVIGVDDSVAEGADQALVQQVTATHRNPNLIYIAGMDGDINALKYIANHGGTYGLYRASGALDLVSIGKAVADLPIEILHGRPATGLFLNYLLITKASKAKALLAAYKKYGGA
jgi:ribose transport system substrate-binding protein